METDELLRIGLIMTDETDNNDIEKDLGSEESKISDSQVEESQEPVSKVSVKNDNEVNGVLLEFTAHTIIGKSEDASLIIKSNEKEEVKQETAKVIPLATQAPIVAPSDSQILEAQIKLIAVFVSEAKMLEAELNKLIKAMYAKSPESKPYLLKMKKLIQDHANIEKALDEAKKVS